MSANRIAKLSLVCSDAAQAKFEPFRDFDFTVSFEPDGVQLRPRDYYPRHWATTIIIKARKVKIDKFVLVPEYKDTSCKFLYKLARLEFSDLRVDALGGLVCKDVAVIIRNFLD